MIPLLIGIPAVLAVLFQLIRNEKARGYVVYAGAGIIMLTTVIFIVRWSWRNFTGSWRSRRERTAGRRKGRSRHGLNAAAERGAAVPQSVSCFFN